MIATGKNIIAIIESNMDEMTELEQEIARYFTQLDPVDADLTWSSLQPLFTFSPSALTRFAKKCGFSGYREFVFTYQKDHQYLLKHFDHIQRSLTKKVLMDYDQILAATNNLVDEEKLEEIAKLIDNSKRVYFYGIGSSCKP